ncbi:hypothetical protein D043_2482A, partial [Vibrio parahaemolyticus EKP-021]
MSLSSSITAS